MTACKPEHRDCVDAQNHKLPDSACAADERGQNGQPIYPGAHFLYGGSSGGHVGDAVMGGSVSRGGFGSIGGDGGGGDE
jgi:hypothetical protein